jgi:hypothetical protein
VKIGKVVKQSGPNRCAFVMTGPTTGPLAPGDYVELALAGGSAVAAVVDGVQGEATVGPAGEGARYEYTCTLLGDGRPIDLVGLPVEPASRETLARLFSPPSPARLILGEIARRVDRIPFVLDGEVLREGHIGIAGSGPGVVQVLGLLLEEILLKLADARMVVLDAHSEFAAFDRSRPPDDVNAPGTRCAPIGEDDLRTQQDELAAIPKTLVPSPVVSMTRFQPRDFLDALGGEDPPGAELVLHAVWDALLHQQLPMTVASCLDFLPHAGNEERIGAHHARHLLAVLSSRSRLRAVTMSLHALLTRAKTRPLWSPGEGDSLHILQNVKAPRFIQFDLGRYPLADRAVFAECVLQSLWLRGERSRPPTFVVIEEAHRLAPATVEHPWQRRSLEAISRVAAEGPAHGVNLLLVSSRPARLHPAILESCGGFLVLRLRQADDVQALARVSAVVPPALLERIPALQREEVLALGDLGPAVLFRTGRRRMR